MLDELIEKVRARWPEKEDRAGALQALDAAKNIFHDLTQTTAQSINGYSTFIESIPEAWHVLNPFLEPTQS